MGSRRIGDGLMQLNGRCWTLLNSKRVEVAAAKGLAENRRVTTGETKIKTKIRARKSASRGLVVSQKGPGVLPVHSANGNREAEARGRSEKDPLHPCNGTRSVLHQPRGRRALPRHP